jgi:3-isopropylmalate/(R)-2-methylmalate dehydratase large subunit
LETQVTEPQTLYDKVWKQHIVADLGDGVSLLHVDRNFIHDLSGTRAIRALTEQGRTVRFPNQTFACPDHTVSTEPDAKHLGERYTRCVDPLRRLSADAGVRFFDIGTAEFGIIHVIGPELGLTQPGALIVCGDSHTCTHGGLGALAWGIGASEVAHVLATGTVIQKKAPRLRITFDGDMSAGVTAKDLILYVIGREGAAAGSGFAVEYAGTAISAMSIEERMTICNLSIEMGAKVGMIAPDDKTIAYIKGREYAPDDMLWDQAVKYWSDLGSDDGAVFDKEIFVDVAEISPQITWGTSPEHVIGVAERTPDPVLETNIDKRHALEAAYDYTRLAPDTPIEGIEIDRVFIGSCTNGRLSDLRAAAVVIEGRKVAKRVEAWVVPGSQSVKTAAEAEGLDRIFRNAGFDWREPGCSLCVGSNGETIPEGLRCVATSNRNFVGRQGKGSFTHLASPAMAAAAAVTGRITDVRKLMKGANNGKI